MQGQYVNDVIIDFDGQQVRLGQIQKPKTYEEWDAELGGVWNPDW